jgi:malate permease and related proteins
MLAARIADILVPLFAIAVAGFVYARLRPTDMSVVNRLNMDVFLPALIFSALSAESFQLGAYGWLAAGGFAVVLGSGLLAWPVARWLGFDWRTLVPPVMFNNAGNLGLPLAVFALGDAALPAAVLLLVIETGLHFSLGIRMIDRRASWLLVARLPIIVATAAGLLFSGLGLTLPELAQAPLDFLAQIAIPLMLFALGVRMTDVRLEDWRIGVTGAVLCPLTGLAIAAACVWLMPLPADQVALLVLFGALPPAVLNFMVAESWKLEPRRVASIVLMGNLLAVAVIPLVLVFVLPEAG